MDLDLIFHAADQVLASAIGGDQAGDRLAVLGNDNAFRIEMIQHRKALFFELGCVHLLHVSSVA